MNENSEASDLSMRTSYIGAIWKTAQDGTLNHTVANMPGSGILTREGKMNILSSIISSAPMIARLAGAVDGVEGTSLELKFSVSPTRPRGMSVYFSSTYQDSKSGSESDVVSFKHVLAEYQLGPDEQPLSCSLRAIEPLNHTERQMGAGDTVVGGADSETDPNIDDITKGVIEGLKASGFFDDDEDSRSEKSTG